MPNGRCKLHGGASTGVPKNHNAFRHGMYAKYHTDEEIAQAEALKLGTVEAQIRICHIRLARALAAEQAAQDKPELDEIIERDGGGEAFARTENKFKKRDYVSIIDKIMARIESLEKTRMALIAVAGGGNAAIDDITRNDTLISPDGAIPANPIL